MQMREKVRVDLTLVCLISFASKANICGRERGGVVAVANTDRKTPSFSLLKIFGRKREGKGEEKQEEVAVGNERALWSRIEKTQNEQPSNHSLCHKRGSEGNECSVVRERSEQGRASERVSSVTKRADRRAVWILGYSGPQWARGLSKGICQEWQRRGMWIWKGWELAA